MLLIIKNNKNNKNNNNNKTKQYNREIRRVINT